MENKDNIIKNIIYIFMVFSLVYIFGLSIKLELSLGLQGFFVFLISFIIKFFIINPILVYVFIGLSFFAIILINHFFPLFISPFFERTVKLLSNIFYNLKGLENISPDNRLFFWIILIVLLSFFTGILIFKRKRTYFLLPLYIGFFLYYWYNYIDAAYWMMILFLFLFFILITLNKYNMEIFYKDKFLIPNFKDLYSPWMKTGTLYGLIIIILAISLPKSSNIIKWPWLQRKIYSTFPEIEDWRSSSSFSREYGQASYFDFSSTGYESIPSRLGGPVELSDEKIMTVHSDKALYLRGNVKHRYTGNYWEIIGSSLEEHRSGNDFSNLSKLEKKKFYKELSVKITYNSFSSKTIFSPYKPSKVNFKDNSRIKLDRDFGLITNQGIYSGESYYVTAEVPLDYNKLINSDISYKKEDIIDLNKYLEIPDDKITQPTRQLTKNIVKGIDSDIDKARAMEEYLRNNYEYSLDVSLVPEGEEFIDYFLFQEKKGYCTYYATSLAIMLRLEEIPSRYIEGYLAKDLKEEGIYEVSQENAHTWVEAFIEPIGWIRLEPTPAYPISPRYEENKDMEVSESIIDYTDSNLPNRDMLEENKEAAINDQENTLNGNSYIPKNKVEEEDRESNGKRIFLMLISVLLLAVPIRLLFIFLKVKYKDYKTRNFPSNKRVIYLYNDIVQLANILGYPQNPGETHREYADRIAFNFYYFDDKGIKEITEIFIESKYGKSHTPQSHILEMEKFKKNLKVRIRSHLGLFRYLKFYLKL